MSRHIRTAAEALINSFESAAQAKIDSPPLLFYSQFYPDVSYWCHIDSPLVTFGRTCFAPYFSQSASHFDTSAASLFSSHSSQKQTDLFPPDDERCRYKMTEARFCEYTAATIMGTLVQ